MQALAVAEWRASRLGADETLEMVASRLRAVRAPPSEALLGSLAHMLAAEGRLQAALNLLADPPGWGAEGAAQPGCGMERLGLAHGREGAEAGCTSPPRRRLRSETPFAALLAGLSRAAHAPSSVAVLRVMAQHGVAPASQTRRALVQMMRRCSRDRGAPPLAPRHMLRVPLHGAAASDGANRAGGVERPGAAPPPSAPPHSAPPHTAEKEPYVEELLEAQVVSLLDRIGDIMRDPLPLLASACAREAGGPQSSGRTDAHLEDGQAAE